MSNLTYQMKAIIEFYRRGLPLESGEAYHIQILHDDGCDRPDGLGPCNCDPEIGTISEDPPESSGR